MMTAALSLRSRKLGVRCALALAGPLLLSAGAGAEVKHLDAALRQAIFTEHFRVVERVADIPGAVMSAAGQARGPKLAQFKLEMADPGQPFQATDVIVNPALPGRRLIAAYASSDYWILHYEAGGIAHTFHFAAFSWRDGRAHLVWHAEVFHTVATLDDLRRLLRQDDASKVDDADAQFY